MSVHVAKGMILNGCKWEAIDLQLGYGCVHSLTVEQARAAYRAALQELAEAQDTWAHNPHFNAIWDQIVNERVSFDCRQLPLLDPVADVPWVLACSTSGVGA